MSWQWNYLDKEHIRGTVIDTQLLEIVLWLTQLKFTANVSPKSALVCRILVVKA